MGQREKEREVGCRGYGEEERGGLLWFGKQGDMRMPMRRGFLVGKRWKGVVRVKMQPSKGGISESKLVTQKRFPAH